MASQARKVFGAFEKRAPGVFCDTVGDFYVSISKQVSVKLNNGSAHGLYFLVHFFAVLENVNSLP